MDRMRGSAMRERGARRDAADPEAAREAALRILERARRSRAELTRKLREKGFVPAAIENVLERLAAVGLVDDVEYARAFLSERLGRRAAGWRRIELELRRRGIAAQDAAAARARLAEEQGAFDEVALARKLLAQVEARYAKLEPRVRKQRLYALLARRGFDGDAIVRALTEHDRE
jgi:regulatory protein